MTTARIADADREAAHAVACRVELCSLSVVAGMAHEVECDDFAQAIAEARELENEEIEVELRARAQRAREARANYERLGITGEWQDYAAFGAQQEAEAAADTIAARRTR